MSDNLRCSFCLKPSTAVERLIKAPEGRGEIYICSDCIRDCVGILEDTGMPMPQIEKKTIRHRLARKLIGGNSIQQMRGDSN